MDFALKKFLSFWLMPFSFCVLVLVVGLWFWHTGRRPKLGRRLALGGLLLLLIASNHFVARGLIRPLETVYPPIPELSPAVPIPAALASCRYIVILGSGNGHTPGASAITELAGAGLARLSEGIRLLRLLPNAKLILTGPSEGERESHAATLARAATSLGVDPARIELLPQGRNTEEEAMIVHGRVGNEPMALVTSAWHMPRAMALFRKAGARALACPTDFITHPDDPNYFTHLLWEPGALSCTSLAVKERIGQLWAWSRGRI